MFTKNCICCGSVFYKKENESISYWNNKKKFCSKNCANNSRIGKSNSPGTQFRKGQKSYWKGLKNESFSGENNPKWKGGQIEKSCLTCKEKFTVDPYRKDTAKYCSFKCKGIDKKGIVFSPENQFKKGFKTPSPFGKDGKNVGENHWNWQGGKTKELKRLRGTAQYISWRKSVFERDDYTCLLCGIRGATLNADHILPFAFFPELRFDISNGRTLCEECHRTTDTFATKALQFKLISQ